jgi:hypothetical protein
MDVRYEFKSWTFLFVGRTGGVGGDDIIVVVAAGADDGGGCGGSAVVVDALGVTVDDLGIVDGGVICGDDDDAGFEDMRLYISVYF